MLFVCYWLRGDCESSSVFYRPDLQVEAMSGTGRDEVKVAAELVRKGATMLGDPCVKCGGIRISYHGRIYCTGHEDLASVLAAETVSVDVVVAGMKEALLSKLNESVSLLRQENDKVKLEQLVSLMVKYYDLLEKLSDKRQRP